MPPSPQCACCRFCYRSPLVVCSLYPRGPLVPDCPHFAPEPPPKQNWCPPEELREPETPAALVTKCSVADNVATQLDTYPKLTGCCPNCGYKYPPMERVFWDCPKCGWIDDITPVWD